MNMRDGRHIETLVKRAMFCVIAKEEEKIGVRGTKGSKVHIYDHINHSWFSILLYEIHTLPHDVSLPYLLHTFT